ncbi:hypothetical protein ACOSQ4_014384 [Xanthoceras sorbifolium]
MTDSVVEKVEEENEPYDPWLVVTYERNRNGTEGGGNRGVGGKTVKAHGNAGRKQESDGKKVGNEIDRRTGNKAKANLRNVVQGGMTNRSRSGVVIP